MVKPERQEYLGERYFAFSQDSDSVIQVCVSNGNTKKGKANCSGVYLISRLTLLSNYLVIGYLETITAKEYKKQFDKMVKELAIITQ